MNAPGTKRISKKLALMLRHHPEHFDVTLDAEGWADVEEVLRGLANRGLPIDRERLVEVVRTNDKRRYTLSPDGTRIRANQGHSVPIDLGLEPAAPPEVLYHGTISRFLDSIRERGLHSGTRQHVHLSADEETATTVGARRGRPLVLVIEAARMAADGHVFHLSENGVWLTDRVPPEYLRFPD